MLEKKYKYITIYFIILQILLLFRNFLLNDFILLFFFCNHLTTLLAIGFYSKNIQLIKGLISVGLIPQLVYILEFFSELLFNTNIISSTGNLFFYHPLEFIITLLIHFTTLTIALLFTYKEKTNINSLKYSSIYLIVLFILTILLTPKSYDLNCVFNACGIQILQFTNFTLFWIPLTFLLIILPTYYFQKYISKII